MNLRALAALSILGFIVFIGINTAIPAYCQEKEEKRQVDTFSGIVSSVNWVESTIAIRYVVNRGTRDVSFLVPPEAMIYKRKRLIWLSEVNIGDHVTVSYYADRTDVLKIASIIIEV